MSGDLLSWDGDQGTDFFLDIWILVW